MDCPSCTNSMSSGISKCMTTSYDIVDANDNLLMAWKSHDLPSDDDEIGTSVNCYYCLACGIVEHLSSN